MKIENRLLIGRDFFADWLSVAFNFLPNREIKSSLAASQPPRVSSTIKPRCDAARVLHTPHTSTSIPAHARSSDLRQHQVSLVSIHTRARFGARVAARPRDSGDRSRRCFPPQKGPVYRGSPPPRSTRLARSIVDAENTSIRPMTSHSTKFTGSERVYILGAVPTTALSGALVRENHRTSSADSHSPLHLSPNVVEATPNLSTMPSPQNVYTALSIISLGGLIGMGVAVGSGVSMMAMAMAEEEQKMVAPSVVEKPSTARGFAASVTERR